MKSSSDKGKNCSSRRDENISCLFPRAQTCCPYPLLRRPLICHSPAAALLSATPFPHTHRRTRLQIVLTLAGFQAPSTRIMSHLRHLTPSYSSTQSVNTGGAMAANKSVRAVRGPPNTPLPHAARVLPPRPSRQRFFFECFCVKKKCSAIQYSSWRPHNCIHTRTQTQTLSLSHTHNMRALLRIRSYQKKKTKNTKKKKAPFLKKR